MQPKFDEVNVTTNLSKPPTISHFYYPHHILLSSQHFPDVDCTKSLKPRGGK